MSSLLASCLFPRYHTCLPFYRTQGSAFPHSLSLLVDSHLQYSTRVFQAQVIALPVLWLGLVPVLSLERCTTCPLLLSKPLGGWRDISCICSLPPKAIRVVTLGGISVTALYSIIMFSGLYCPYTSTWTAYAYMHAQ